MKNQNRFMKKSAMTMAEIIIVVIIVAVIAGIFVAMPRKNVAKFDRAKYYIAYNMLKRLQDEQLAQGGNINLGNFCNQVSNWLNTAGNLNCPAASVQLTNGMVLQLNAAPANGQLSVLVDIDGNDTGTACVEADNRDCHLFILYDNGRVTPDTYAVNGQITAANTDWISFKVFRFDNNGRMVIEKTGISYNDAWNCINNADLGGGVRACPNCQNGSERLCLMEAIHPLN